MNAQIVAKFCKKMQKEFECQSYFEKITGKKNCQFCPLMLFLLTVNLALEKNLSIGEAFRLSISGLPEQAVLREKVREMARDKFFQRRRR